MGKAKRKSDTRTDVQRALDERRESSRSAWSKRHPGIAAGERALRKARAELLERWNHKNDGTAETHEHARRQEGSLARLYKNGTIDCEQLASAAEIATVAERIGRDVSVRTASLETRVDTGPRRYDALHDEKLGQVRREIAYTRWRAMLAAPAPVLDMLVGSFSDDGPIGFTIVAVRYRIHNRKAKRMLLQALDLWPEILSDVFRQVDGRDLDFAHARLAA